MSKPGIGRREFLGGCLAAAAAATLGHAWLPRAVADTLPASGQPPALARRPLGRTGATVSILGLGGAGFLSRTTDPEAAAKILHAALDGGITFFDTAHNYDHCEANFGLVAGTARRREMFLATKVEDRTDDGAMRQFEESLRRLRTDRVELLQIHYVCKTDDVAAFGKPGGVLAALRRLKEQKTARFIGMTGHPDFPQVREALAMYDDFDTFMGFVNPTAFARPAATEQLPLARQKKLGIIAMKVFGGGGTLIGNGPGKAPVADLLRYALSQDIATAIPAVDSVEQLAENLRAAVAFKPMTAAEQAALGDRINARPAARRDPDRGDPARARA
jgi:aryl-alcohol dehydrogenase-like predicted oxidoreductase